MNTAQTRPISAAFAMVVAMMILGVIDNYVVHIAAEIGLWQFHFVRAWMMIPMVGIMALIGLGSLRVQRPKMVLLRTLILTTSMLLYFSALALMPIAQALAGLFTSPIFVLLLSILWMGQRIGPWRIAAIVIGFAGTIMVLQTGLDDFQPRTLIPVAAGFFYAVGALMTRHYCAQESTLVLLGAGIVGLGLAGGVGLALLELWPLAQTPGPEGFISRGWVWPMWQSLPLVVVQAVGTVVGVFLIIKAYQWGEPPSVAVFEYTIMIFGPLYAFAMFGQGIGAAQIIGVGLIALAGAVIALRSG